MPAGARALAQGYTERVDVARLALDVHALHDDGRPIRDLSAADFRVRIDGAPALVLSARWTTAAVADRPAHGSGAPAVSPPAVPAESPRAPVEASDAERFGLPAGRQILFLIQKDFEPTRLEGLVDLLRRARAFVEGLEPDDRVAVLSFDSRLVLWTDFTADRRAVNRVLERGILLDTPPTSAPALGAASFALAFDAGAARRASSMEQALLVVARAAALVPGAKALVILGHGFGRLGLAGFGDLPTRVDIDDEYGDARRLFVAGRTAVYCLDTTRAASHTLEAGLMAVAADTGGFYARTHDFPRAAITRLAAALAGRYELEVERPRLPPGEHRIVVELIGRKGRVLARRSYTEKG